MAIEEDIGPVPERPRPRVPNPAEERSVGTGVNEPGSPANVEPVYTAPNTNVPNIPGEHEVWRNTDTGQVLVVIYIPDTDIPLVWDVPEHLWRDVFQDAGGVEAVVGSNNYTTQQILAAGAIDGGSIADFPIGSGAVEHPWDTFISNYELARRVNPALDDPEVLAIHYIAHLEGRNYFLPGEYESTNYYKTHTIAEQEWARFSLTNPADAAQQYNDAVLETERSLRQLGIRGVSADAIEYIASRAVSGRWSEALIGNQLYLLSVGEMDGLDDGLKALVEGTLQASSQLETQRGEVRAMVNQWLGPAVAEHWSATEVDRWAQNFISSDATKDELTEILQDQRLALFPDQTNREVSYEMMARPWRSVWVNTLGEQPDETDPLFYQLIKQNDIGQAETLLRKRGLATGNTAVTTAALRGLQAAAGSGVRQAVS